jgi:DNA-directed RNA polymerase alpha subunit
MRQVFACPHCQKMIGFNVFINAAPDPKPDPTPDPDYVESKRVELDQSTLTYPWPKPHVSRMYNICRTSNLNTFRDIYELSEEALLRLPLIGTKTSRLFRTTLASMGLYIGMLPPRKQETTNDQYPD